MNNKIKILAMILVLSASLSVFSACSGGDSRQPKTSEGSTASQSSSSDEKSDAASDASKTESTQQSSEEASKESKPDPTDEKEQGSVPELSSSDNVGEVINGILVYERTAFEQFYGYDELAKGYGETMQKLADYLGDDIKVYNVLVPTHCGVQLPQNVMDEYGLPDQNKYIQDVFSCYKTDGSNPIVTVNTYDTLMHHRDEYIYLKTDHHWSGLGAYYAYKDFCKAAGVDYVKLSELEKGEIEGYYGSLTAYIDDSYVDPDTVEYYKTDKDITTKVYDNDGTGGTDTNLIHSYADSSFAYGVFLGGDNGLMVSKNPDGNGKKIAVVKESYGNAFCPYIAYTYGETHMIDFRYITFDFKQYLIDNDIHEVIFINNNMATATPARCEELEGLIK